ncbi:MAG: nicotinate-nucleotide adenylyltransferase [Phycisphaerae bacterium]
MSNPDTFAWMGGTFDPIHCGHLILARHVAETAGFDQVVFMPAAAPPHKPGPAADGQGRLEMIRLAVADEPRLGVCDLELRRSGDAPSYTIDTVDELAGRFPDRKLTMVIGLDMLADLPNWHRADEVVQRIDFVVLARPGWQGQSDEMFETLTEAFGQETSRQLAESIIEAPLLEISSTDIRARRRRGLSIRFLVPDPVAEYIEDRNLYPHR